MVFISLALGTPLVLIQAVMRYCRYGSSFRFRTTRQFPPSLPFEKELIRSEEAPL